MNPIRAFERRQLRSRPFPEAWTRYLDEHVPFHRRLPEALRERFREQLTIFEDEEYFIAAGGLDEVSEDEPRVADVPLLAEPLHRQLTSRAYADGSALPAQHHRRRRRRWAVAPVWWHAGPSARRGSCP